MRYGLKTGTNIDGAGTDQYNATHDTASKIARNKPHVTKNFLADYYLNNLTFSMSDKGFQGDDYEESTYTGKYFIYNQTVDGLKWATIPAKTSDGQIPYYVEDSNGALTPIFAHEASIPMPECTFVKSSTDGTMVVWHGDLLTEDSKMSFDRSALYPKIELQGGFQDTASSPGNKATLTIHYSSTSKETFNVYSTVFVDIQAPGGYGAAHYNPKWFVDDEGGSGGGGGAYCRVGIDLSYDPNHFGGSISKRVEIEPVPAFDYVELSTVGSKTSNSLDTGLTIGYGQFAIKSAGGAAGGTVGRFGDYAIPNWIKYKGVSGGRGGDGGGDNSSGKAGDPVQSQSYAPMFDSHYFHVNHTSGGSGGATDGDSCGGGGGGAAYLGAGGNGAGYNNEANNNWSSTATGNVYGGGGGGGHFRNPVGFDANGDLIKAPGAGRPGVFRIYAIKYPD